MKKWMIAALAAQLATGAGAVAQQREFVCTSEIDGTEYRLTRFEGAQKGSVKFGDTTGDAQVFPGLNNLTFILTTEQHVMTFFVKSPDLSYNLSIRRPVLHNDRGQCTETGA
ncbi:hypothetical protein [Ruegeria sp. HKCCA4812]|uniref:hypothetical protein n=1 Tax=Ruegeria sp. HKCCA4812 TaxID=2682993 RepID=UPI001489C64B|nr:hypothetical protein [Ruegeria sp. HKCCA4812]